jgi:hypothetical protein
MRDYEELRGTMRDYEELRGTMRDYEGLESAVSLLRQWLLTT